ncbi:MAG: MerR family transcriptional regulator [Cognatishimia sp.]|uniref:MerR family transcriptional regulator n=1 Tax=Cognatishimia sp. TaxID=2211648 RepID=UPI0040581CAE
MDITVSCDRLTRGALSKRSGCNIETIRYYEKIELLLPPERSAGGHRLYSDLDQRRLRFIMRGRELGFSIDELRGLMSMANTGNHSCEEIHAMTLAHMESVRQKIDDLARLEKTLSNIAAQCTSNTVPDCPVIDALWAD